MAPVKSRPSGGKQARRRKATEVTEPSPELNEFLRCELREAIRRASELIRLAGGGESPWAGPSLHPFVATLNGNDIRRVTVSVGEAADVAEHAGDLIAQHGGRGFAAMAHDGFLTLDGTRSNCLFVRGQQQGSRTSYEIAQPYAVSRRGIRPLGQPMLLGTAEPIFPKGRVKAAKPDPRHEALAAWAMEFVMRIHAKIPIETLDKNYEIEGPRLLHGKGRFTLGKSVLFGFCSYLAALPMAADTLRHQEGAQAEWAAFVHDELASIGGSAERSFRVRVQYRGDPFSSLYSQPYLAKVGRVVKAVGGLEFVGLSRSLFPGAR